MLQPKTTKLNEAFDLPPAQVAEILEQTLNKKDYAFSKETISPDHIVYSIEVGAAIGVGEQWLGYGSNTQVVVTITKGSNNKTNIVAAAGKNLSGQDPYVATRNVLDALKLDIRQTQPAPSKMVSTQIPATGNSDERGPKITILSPTFDFKTNKSKILLTGNVISSSKVKDIQILVNGKPLTETRGIAVVKAEKGGTFTHNIDLQDGENIIIVNVTEKNGKVGQRVIKGIRTARGTFQPKELAGAFKGQRWAVIVGVSRYENSRKGIPNLRYADADARMFYEFLKSPQGGGFADDHIIFLENENATLPKLKSALFDFLGKAIREDLVVVYFAGHGAPDPLNTSNLFLLTHDTDPDQMRSTAFPMWDLQTALARFIPSERVVVLVDACHSAGVGDVATRNIGDENVINRYLLELSKAGKGRAIFTASESGELSHESPEWGGGHGVFTWFMLEGLKGSADSDSDGVVSLGEMIDYTSEQVRRATKSSQHPDTSGYFDRNLPMAVLNTPGS
ncbi:caspase family protein [Nitrospina watsonii]|nr:caspase family protein [Nitrospina watsonii]